LLVGGIHYIASGLGCQGSSLQRWYLGRLDATIGNVSRCVPVCASFPGGKCTGKRRLGVL